MTTPTVQAQAQAQRERLRQRIRAAGLAHLEAEIVARMRTSIRLFTEPATTALPLGVSRFGGQPDLPPTTPWPIRAGVPFNFVLQLDLAQLATWDLDGLLPREGLISVFVCDDYRDDDYGDGCVILTPASELARLERRVVPDYDDSEFELNELRACSCRFEVEVCIPPIEGPTSDDLWREPDDRSRYWDDVWMDRNSLSEGPFHRIGGYPDMNFNQHFETRVQLLQIDYDEASGWEIGDAQPLRVLIEPEDLAAGELTKVSFNSDQ